HSLRLLSVKLGTQYCPDCGIAIEAQSAEAIVARVLRACRGRRVAVLAPLVTARKGYYTDLARWALARGVTHLRVGGVLQPTANWPRLARFKEHDIDLPVGELVVTPRAEAALRALIERALDLGKGVVRIATHPRRHGAGGAGAPAEAVYSTRRACPKCGQGFPALD